VATVKRAFFRQICFDEFFALLWASLNIHHNYTVQNSGWSMNAALLNLFNNVFPILSVRMVCTIGVFESIENIDVWELCKLQTFVVSKLLVGYVGVYSLVSTWHNVHPNQWHSEMLQMK